jgi:hypothetical protein
MAPIARLCLGEGARCSCLAKYIRPSKDVAAALVNPEPGRRIDDLIAISRDVTDDPLGEDVCLHFLSEQHYPRPPPCCGAMD